MVRRDSSASRRYGEERTPSSRRDGREAHQPAGGTVLREPSVRSRDGEEKLVSHQEGWLRETHQQAISDSEEIHLPARRMVRMIHSPAGTMLRRGSSASN
jgi:hypothetical protein